MSSNTINTYIQAYGLIAISLFMFSNGIISTPPSEVTLVFAGILAASGYHSLFLTIAVAVLGNLAGAVTLYQFGRKFGLRWVQKLREWALAKGMPLMLVNVIFPDAEFVASLGKALSQRGTIWIGVFRCLPLVRSIVSLPAGMANMPILPFLGSSFVGMTAWALLWEGIGYFLGANWDRISRRLYIILLILLIVLLCEVIRRIVKAYYFKKDRINE